MKRSIFLIPFLILLVGMVSMAWGATFNVPSDDYPTIQSAINAANSAGGDEIIVASGEYTVTSTIIVNKSLTIEGAGIGQTVVQTAGGATDPVNVFAVSADNVTIKLLTIKQKKTSNTSVEAAVSVTGSYPWNNNLDAFTLDTCRLESMEFCITIRAKNWTIMNSELAYVGPSANNNRLIGVYGNAGTSTILNNQFWCSTDEPARTRFVYCTSSDGSERYAGVLIISENIQIDGSLSQFYSQDELRGTGLTLNGTDNIFNATNADFVLYGLTPLDYFTAITLTGNQTSNIGGKGLLGLDGPGTVGSYGSTELTMYNNILTNPTVDKVGWSEATGSAGGMVGYSTSAFSDTGVSILGPPPVYNETQDTWYYSIQSAINAAVDDDVIQIAAGTYTEALSIGKSLTLIGSGPVNNPTTIITSSASPIVQLSVSGKSFTFQNLIIEGNNTNLGIRAGGSINIEDFVMQDVIARDCRVAVYFSENSAATYVNNLSFENVTITNSSHIGAYIGRSVVNGIVNNSTFSYNGYSDADATAWQKCGIQFIDFYGAIVPRVQVTNSTFINNGVGASSIERTGLVLYSATNTLSANELMTVSNCSFTDHPQYAVRIRNGYYVHNEATVNGTFTNNYLDIWFSNMDGYTTSTTNVRRSFAGIRTVGPDQRYDYNTIQAAINAANPGDVVDVAAGIYNEAVTVNRRITLQGQGDSSIIESNLAHGIKLTAGGDTETSRLTVKRFKIAGPNYGVLISQAVIGHITLENLNVDGSASTGFQIEGTGTLPNPLSPSVVTDLIVLECKFNNSVSQMGLSIDKYSSVDEVLIINCEFNGNRRGFYSQRQPNSFHGVTNINNIEIRNTKFNNNRERGINLEKLSNAVFDNIEVHGNGTTAGTFFTGLELNLKFADYQNITIQNSSFTANGLLETQGYGSGINVKARDDGSYASNPASLNTLNILNNDVYGNQRGIGIGEYGVSSNSVSNITIEDNRIYDNSVYGLINCLTSTIDVTKNWWGDPAGPTPPGSRYGDSVSDNVIYDPWWTDENLTLLGSDEYVINQDETFTTIQAAIIAADPGDTIYIPAGNYGLAEMGGNSWEPVSVIKSLTLIGAGSGSTILDATGLPVQCDVMGIRASNITVEGMTIKGGTYGVRVSASASTYTGLSFEDVEITQNTQSGFVFDGAGAVSGVDFTSCAFTYNGGRGLYVAPGKSLSNVTFTNCDASYNTNSGLHFQGIQSNINIIGGNYSYNIGVAPPQTAAYGSGIWFEYTNGAIVDGITAIGNGSAYPSHGIYVRSASTNVDINDCDISGSLYGILYLSVSADASNDATGNQISDCVYGLADYHGKGNTHTLNSISGCDFGVFTGGTLGVLVFEDNIFGANDIQVKNISTAGTPLDLELIITDNSWPGGYYLAPPVIYSSTAEMLYVDSPDELIQDSETQTYSVKALFIEDLRGFTVQLKIPSADFEQPVHVTSIEHPIIDFMLGQAYDGYTMTSLLPILYDSSDPAYYTYTITGTYLGGFPGITGGNKELLKVNLTSKPDRDNVPNGCWILLPLNMVELKDDQDPYSVIPCLATEAKKIIIDAGHPTMVHNNAGTYTSPYLLPVIGDGLGLTDRPILDLTFTDNYNLDYTRYLILGVDDEAPEAIVDFTNALFTVDGLSINDVWQLTADVDLLDDGTYSVYFLVVDDANNFSIYDWDFIKDTTPPGAVVWDALIPCRTTAKENNKIDLKWANPVGTVQNHIWVLSYTDRVGGYTPPDTAYPEYPATANAIPAAPDPYDSDPQNGWNQYILIDPPAVEAIYTLNIATRDYYYITIFAEDASGNISAAPAAPYYRESISYWPGDVALDTTPPAHAVESNDITMLSAVWGLADGHDDWNNIIDVGPTVDNGRRSRPTPDNVIDIEDLMIFAMNYNNTVYTYYPRDDDAPQIQPIRIDMQFATSGDKLFVDLWLGDNDGNVRGLNIPFSYGSGLSLESLVNGDVWPDGSLILHKDKDNLFELSGSVLGGNSAITGNGILATVIFNITGDDTEIELRHMIARGIMNEEIEIVDNPNDVTTDNEDPVNVIPVVSYLGDNYPNPFNPSTTVRFGLSQAGKVRVSVYNTRGQLVRTLVNDNMQAGTHNVVWNGKDNSNRLVSSGIYFIRMETRDNVSTKKALMLK